MARFLSALLWTTVFLLLLAGIDQLLVRAPATHPAHLAVATFYRDLRSRLIELGKGMARASSPAKPVKFAPSKGRPPANVEGVIEQYQPRPALPPPPSVVPAKLKSTPQAKEPAPRYIYADDRGVLHFSETLAEIPEQYRARATALGE